MDYTMGDDCFTGDGLVVDRQTGKLVRSVNFPIPFCAAGERLSSGDVVCVDDHGIARKVEDKK